MILNWGHLFFCIFFTFIIFKKICDLELDRAVLPLTANALVPGAAAYSSDLSDGFKVYKNYRKPIFAKSNHLRGIDMFEDE